MTRIALAVIAVMGAFVLLGRSVQGRTAIAPAPLPDDIDWLSAWVIEPTPRPLYVTAAEWSN